MLRYKMLAILLGYHFYVSTPDSCRDDRAFNFTSSGKLVLQTVVQVITHSTLPRFSSTPDCCRSDHAFNFIKVFEYCRLLSMWSRIQLYQGKTSKFWSCIFIFPSSTASSMPRGRSMKGSWGGGGGGGANFGKFKGKVGSSKNRD